MIICSALNKYSIGLILASIEDWCKEPPPMDAQAYTHPHSSPNPPLPVPGHAD